MSAAHIINILCCHGQGSHRCVDDKRVAVTCRDSALVSGESFRTTVAQLNCTSTLRPRWSSAALRIVDSAVAEAHGKRAHVGELSVCSSHSNKTG